MMESSVKSISRPVIERLPVEQLDEFACRQLDRVCQPTNSYIIISVESPHLFGCADSAGEISSTFECRFGWNAGR